MATNHSISVLTNSCIKPPINPQTGLSASINERSQLSQSFTARDFGDGDGDDDESLREAPVSRLSWAYRTDSQGKRRSHSQSGRHSRNNSLGNVNMDKTDSMIEELTRNVDNLTDAEFYERLIQLKNEHKKTLSMCEKLYQEKLNAEGDGIATRQQNNHVLKDQIRDMSGKPPLARPVPANANGVRKSQVRTPYSLTNRNAWEQLSDGDSDGEEDNSLYGSTESLNELNESYNGQRVNRSAARTHDFSPMSRIDDMWDNFSVEDYAPDRTRSETTMKSSATQDQQQKEWRHRITIPKPFKMTLRDVNKPSQTSSKEEYLKERAEKEKMEELECQKKFKATPAPAHIYVPLYDEIMEVQETKRRANHELREELLRSSEKPFKFMQREEVKKREKYTKAVEEHMQNKLKHKKKPFKAKPARNDVIDESIAERIKEEEEYRKIRKQMRAVELLRQSKLPPSMAAREEQKRIGVTTTKPRKSALKKSTGLSEEPTFRPRINENIPDFERKHRQLMTEMSRKKYDKEATVVKPFKLRTAEIPSRKSLVYEDIERDEETLKETRWPYTNPRAKPSPAHSSLSASLRSSPFSSSAENIPSRMTASQELRNSVTRQKLEQMSDKDFEEERKARDRKIREKRLQKFVAEKAAANELSLSRKDEKDKLKKIKEQDRARMEEYRRELDEMKSRVENRPLLFEQTSQVNARKAAERKYQETLKNAGIDEEFVQRKGQKYRPSDHVSDADSDQERSFSPIPDNNGLSDGDMTPEGSDDENVMLA